MYVKEKNVEKVLSLLSENLQESENKEERVPDSIETINLPDYLVEAGAAVLAVTAVKQMGTEKSIPALFENVEDLKSVESIKQLGSNALNTLAEGCQDLNTNIIEAIEQTRENLGTEGISRQYAILCNQASFQNKGIYTFKLN